MSQKTAVRPGRRPGSETTAQEILAHAREVFARRGYAHTSVRSVARAAGVDPAMIHYFFGSKEGLFQAAIEIPISLDMPAMVDFRRSTADGATRIARLFIALWEDPAVAQALSSMLLEAGLQSHAAQALRRFMVTYVGNPVLRQMGADDHPETRLRLVVGLMASVAIQRRFDRSSSLAALNVDQTVDLIAPLVRHIMQVPLPASLPPEPATGAEFVPWTLVPPPGGALPPVGEVLPSPVAPPGGALPPVGEVRPSAVALPGGALSPVGEVRPSAVALPDAALPPVGEVPPSPVALPGGALSPVGEVLPSAVALPDAAPPPTAPPRLPSGTASEGRASSGPAPGPGGSAANGLPAGGLACGGMAPGGPDSGRGGARRGEGTASGGGEGGRVR
ncbi:MAG: TetR family transcriptional regulator [Bifidobacteriaceae bacterium]|jgi:AcrR family transcriptional regulator|nr:TetR family transcriptional regulator [Bifidobacteriaceae bacterium]